MKRKYKKESNRNFGAEKYSNCNENTYYRGLGIDLNRKKKESVSLKICHLQNEMQREWYFLMEQNIKELWNEYKR